MIPTVEWSPSNLFVVETAKGSCVDPSFVGIPIGPMLYPVFAHVGIAHPDEGN